MESPEVKARLLESSMQTSALEGVAEKLEDRLMLLEAASGKNPQAEVSSIVQATPALPADADAEARVPVLTEKSAALQGLVQKLALRISVLEAESPRASQQPSILAGYSLSTPKLSVDPAEAEQQLTETSRQLCSLETFTEKLEGRLMLLETEAGRTPQAEALQLLGATPALPANSDMKARIPVLTEKSSTLESLIQKFTARVSFLEASSPRSPSSASSSPQKVTPQKSRAIQFAETPAETPSPSMASQRTTSQQSSPTAGMGRRPALSRLNSSKVYNPEVRIEAQLVEASQQICSVEGLAKKLEARLMLLETAAGKTPHPQVLHLLSAAPELPANGELKARVPVLTQKSTALESLVHLFAARVSFLEANSPRLASPVKNLPQKSRAVQFEDKLSTSKQQSLTNEISRKREEVMSQHCNGLKPPAETEVRVLQASSQACNLEGLAEKFEARVMLLEAAAGKNPQAEVSQILDATPAFPADADIEERVPVLVEKSTALESSAQKLLARIAFLEIDAVELFPSNGDKQEVSVKEAQIFDELIQKERQQAEAVLSQHKEAHAVQVLQLHEALKKERRSKDEIVKKMELQLQASGKPAILPDGMDGLGQKARLQAEQIVQLHGALKEERRSKAEAVKGLELQLQKVHERATLQEERVKGLEAKLAELGETRSTQVGSGASLEEQSSGASLQERLAQMAETREVRAQEQYLFRKGDFLDVGSRPTSDTKEAQTWLHVQEQSIQELEAKLAFVSAQAEAKLAAATAEYQQQCSERAILHERTVKELELEKSKQQILMQEQKIKGLEAQLAELTSARDKEQTIQELQAKLAAANAAEARLAAATAEHQKQCNERAVSHGQTIKELELEKSKQQILTQEQKIQGLEAKLAELTSARAKELGNGDSLQEQRIKGLEAKLAEVGAVRSRGLGTGDGLQEQRIQELEARLAAADALTEAKLAAANAEHSERAILHERSIKDLEAKLAAECQKTAGDCAVLYEKTIKELEAKLVASATERQRQKWERAMMHEQNIKELETKLFLKAAERQQQSDERFTRYENTIQELQEKLAASVAECERLSSERAILHEQSFKELEAKVCSAAQRRQLQFSERTMVLEQTIKDLEAKLAAATTGRPQLALSGEPFQTNGTLEHEKRVGESTKDGNLLQQVVQDYQDKLQAQSEKFDRERKLLLAQVDELQRKVAVMEKTQATMAANHPFSICR
mmetsp:Transcript_42391/g.79506  ORF Transcript_42391/g.79506 Transcript_42391/m.79506 type:complete len:1212 (-) Transcript_42391:160-3795(-)